MESNPDQAVPDGTADPLEELLQQARWPEASSDPLDRLLGMAQWPEPHRSGSNTSSFESRTEIMPFPACDGRHESLMPSDERNEFRSVTVRRRTPGKAWVFSVAAAAAAIVVVAVAWWEWPFPAVLSPAGSSGNIAAHLPQQPSRSNASPSLPERVAVPTPPAADDSIAPSGGPSQRLLFEMILARTQATWQSPEDELLDRTLAQRMIEPNGDLQQLIEPLMVRRAEYERRLLERFDLFTGDQQAAAIELLGCIASEASVPQLLYLSRKPATHAPAVRTLLDVADTRTLAWLAKNESDPGLHDEIIAALQLRAEEQSPVFAFTNQGERSCFDFGLEWQQQSALP